MKKIVSLCVCTVAAATIMSGCSADGNANPGTVSLSEYKGIKINVEAPEVTEDEVESRIQTVLSQNPDQTEVERAAKDGDTVNIDYKGTKDGEEFDGGTAYGQDLKLGSGRMIDGFESGLVGTKKGETKTLTLTFPEDYSEESLAGQEAVFEVTVNSVKEQKDAVLDDAFVQRVSDCQTVDEYRAYIKEELMKQKQQSADQEIRMAVLQNVVENSEFKFSKSGLSARYNDALKQYKSQAKMYGMSLSQLAQANGMDEPSMKESIYASVKEEAKSEMVIDAIAAQEGLALEEEDKTLYAQAVGQGIDYLNGLYGEERVEELALDYKVTQFLAVNAINEAENPAEISQPSAEETAAETTAETAEETTAEETAAETTEETTAEESSEETAEESSEEASLEAAETESHS